ncbi:hypothetical protein HR11_03900 [Porphyromonas macacae]|uniref:Lumazine-binding domain n=1 Tax=Porphyromonas macacae TaxID=28115 RepID=A0A0A2GAH9_9PORP|nr:DUF4878 domain-containing protein [Porphyromonas macacae]KGN74357.1 hypothetical protein HQ47_04695 [Porphyromonas macacae]KGN99417.1 hypothetical protein HR11_03900 [Porphyromonas macacae]SUB77566.1 Lumazine-binding domain [Porphyromonas macacae]SUB88742.1 Lumazine-binding domain [Porphyromonas macacae]
MKKLLFIPFAMFLLVSCSSGPKKTAQKFTENVAKGKIEEAKKYATESAGKLLDLGSSLGTMPLDPNFKFEFVKDSIVENKAWVTYKDQNGKESTIDLVKIDGKWLVHQEFKK